MSFNVSTRPSGRTPACVSSAVERVERVVRRDVRVHDEPAAIAEHAALDVLRARAQVREVRVREHGGVHLGRIDARDEQPALEQARGTTRPASCRSRRSGRRPRRAAPTIRALRRSSGTRARSCAAGSAIGGTPPGQRVSGESARCQPSHHSSRSTSTQSSTSSPAAATALSVRCRRTVGSAVARAARRRRRAELGSCGVVAFVAGQTAARAATRARAAGRALRCSATVPSTSCQASRASCASSAPRDLAERVAPGAREHAAQRRFLGGRAVVGQAKRDEAGPREREPQLRMLARDLVLQCPLGARLGCGEEKASRHACAGLWTWGMRVAASIASAAGSISPARRLLR